MCYISWKILIRVSDNTARTIAMNDQFVILVSVSAMKWAMSGDVVIIIMVSRGI